jgi:hypothetical protein
MYGNRIIKLTNTFKRGEKREGEEKVIQGLNLRSILHACMEISE